VVLIFIFSEKGDIVPKCDSLSRNTTQIGFSPFAIRKGFQISHAAPL
jgi:hypothetical protein